MLKWTGYVGAMIIRERLEEIGVAGLQRFSVHSLRHSLGVFGGRYLPQDELMA